MTDFITKEHSETASLVLPRSLVQEIDRLARENERSKSAQVRIMLRDWLEIHDAPTPTPEHFGRKAI